MYPHIYCYSLINAKFDVRANLQTANVIGRLTTNLGKTLIEKYSEIDNTEIFLK